MTHSPEAKALVDLIDFLYRIIPMPNPGPDAVKQEIAKLKAIKDSLLQTSAPWGAKRAEKHPAPKYRLAEFPRDIGKLCYFTDDDRSPEDTPKETSKLSGMLADGASKCFIDSTGEFWVYAWTLDEPEYELAQIPRDIGKECYFTDNPVKTQHSIVDPQNSSGFLRKVLTGFGSTTLPYTDSDRNHWTYAYVLKTS